MAISYDTIGNPLTFGNTTYTWKQGRELAALSDGATTWMYIYDASGMRIRRSNGSVTYNYVYNGSQLSQMTVNNNKLVFTYTVSGAPASVTWNGTRYYYITNLQGDVVGIVNSAREFVVTYVYDAWGNIRAVGGTMAATLGMLNPLTYRGYVYDHETHLYYLQSRYYNPEIGRFINADAYVATGQGMLGNNMFAYCRNNPVIRKDASGTDDICVTDGEDDNPFNDVYHGAGGAGGGGGYVYGVDFSSATYSSLSTGGIYNTGYIAYGYNTGSANPGQGSNSTPSACFIVGTLIKTQSGDVPIEDIDIGDQVWALDEATGDITLKEVVEIYINQSNELIHIFVNGDEIVTTPTHPFYSPVKGWTDACKLRAGDILVLINGEYAVVEKVQHEILEAPIAVYNFQVEGYHTYYVAHLGVLVHNACAKDSQTKKAKDIANSLGYSKVQGVFSHGQAIYYNSDATKTLRYISADIDSHNGGFWKAASSINNLRQKSTRSGTYSWDLLERIGD